MFGKRIGYLCKSDRRAILTLLVLVAIACIAIYTLQNEGMESNPISAQSATKQSEINIASKETDNKNDEPAKLNKELFYFDPNTADRNQLLRLGLQEWQVRNICKYRTKGGIYRSKEDFAYVYGLTVGQYRRLAPYIRISDEYLPASTLAEVRNHKRYNYYDKKEYSEKETTEIKTEKPAAYTPKLRKGEQLNINASDTTQLKTIPGIGSYYADRKSVV